MSDPTLPKHCPLTTHQSEVPGSKGPPSTPKRVDICGEAPGAPGATGRAVPWGQARQEDPRGPGKKPTGSAPTEATSPAPPITCPKWPLHTGPLSTSHLSAPRTQHWTKAHLSALLHPTSNRFWGIFCSSVYFSHMACRILVPCPGTEPVPLAVEACKPNQGMALEFPLYPPSEYTRSQPAHMDGSPRHPHLPQTQQSPPGSQPPSGALPAKTPSQVCSPRLFLPLMCPDCNPPLCSPFPPPATSPKHLEEHPSPPASLPAPGPLHTLLHCLALSAACPVQDYPPSSCPGAVLSVTFCKRPPPPSILSPGAPDHPRDGSPHLLCSSIPTVCSQNMHMGWAHILTKGKVSSSPQPPSDKPR